MRSSLIGLWVLTLTAAGVAQPPKEKAPKVSLALNTDHSTPLVALAFSGNGSKFVTVETNDVHLWNVSTGERERTWRLPNELRKVAVSPDGRTAAVTYWGKDAKILVWLLNLETGASKSLDSGNYDEEYLTFSPDSQRLVIGGDLRAFIWDIRTWDQRMPVLTHRINRNSQVISVAFNRDGNRLLVSWSGKDNSQVQVWDASPPLDKKLPIVPKVPLTVLPEANDRRAAYASDGRIVAWKLDGAAMDINLWSAEGKQEGATISVPDFPGQRVVRITDDDRLILAAEQKSKVQVCTVNLKNATIEATHTWPIQIQPKHPIAIAPNGKILAAASGPGFQVHLFDLPQSMLIRRIGQADPVPSVVGFSKDSKSVAWGFQQKIYPKSDPRDLVAGLNLATLQPLRKGSFAGYSLWRSDPVGFQWEKRPDGKPGMAFSYKEKLVVSEIEYSRSSATYVTPKGKLGVILGGTTGGLYHIDGVTGKVMSKIESRSLLADQLVVSSDGKYLLVSRLNLALDIYRIDRNEFELLLNIVSVG